MAQSWMQIFLNEWMVMVPGYLKVQEGPPTDGQWQEGGLRLNLSPRTLLNVYVITINPHNNPLR